MVLPGTSVRIAGPDNDDRGRGHERGRGSGLSAASRRSHRDLFHSQSSPDQPSIGMLRYLHCTLQPLPIDLGVELTWDRI